MTSVKLILFDVLHCENYSPSSGNSEVDSVLKFREILSVSVKLFERCFKRIDN